MLRRFFAAYGFENLKKMGPIYSIPEEMCKCPGPLYIKVLNVAKSSETL